MTSQRKTQLKLGLVLVGSLYLTIFWSYGYMADRRAAAIVARADLEDSLRDGARIDAIRNRPALAADRERLVSETTALIERAAGAAGIPPDQLVRITPEPPQRLGDSVYKEKPTQVTLKSVSLQQLVTLTHHLVSPSQGLHAKSLRITSLGTEGAAASWAADLVVTYLIYEPPHSRK